MSTTRTPCQNFRSGGSNCRSIQMIEPDDTLVTSTVSGARDQSLDESGSEIIPLSSGGRMRVNFVTHKISDNYQFEYLYVDALGIANPGDVMPVVVNKDTFGFLVDLAGIPLSEGYILRWRVVVQDITLSLVVDAPESLRLQLPQADTFTATFVNPRGSTSYGFSELRVENLIDSAATQRAIIVQVVAKTQATFTVGLNPPPDTDNYFLMARTP